jgi:hypothetical protein
MVPLRRRLPLPALTADRLIQLLTDYTRQTRASVDLLLVDALALQAYGFHDRYTSDVDAEITEPLEPLQEFLLGQQIPADLTDNFSGWAIVAMPPGYRERATDLIRTDRLRVRLLAPLDFVIAKLRRGTEVDLDDAMFVARRFELTPEQVRTAAAAALAASSQDTALFLFRKTVDLFCESLAQSPYRPSRMPSGNPIEVRLRLR